MTPKIVLICMFVFMFSSVKIAGKISVNFYKLFVCFQNFKIAKLLQKSEMRKDIVIELSYKGFG